MRCSKAFIVGIDALSVEFLLFFERLIVLAKIVTLETDGWVNNKGFFAVWMEREYIEKLG